MLSKHLANECTTACLSHSARRSAGHTAAEKAHTGWHGTSRCQDHRTNDSSLASLGPPVREHGEGARCSPPSPAVELRKLTHCAEQTMSTRQARPPTLLYQPSSSLAWRSVQRKSLHHSPGPREQAHRLLQSRVRVPLPHLPQTSLHSKVARQALTPRASRAEQPWLVSRKPRPHSRRGQEDYGLPFWVSWWLQLAPRPSLSSGPASCPKPAR